MDYSKRIPQEEERQLHEVFRNGTPKEKDAARNEIISGYYALVSRVIRKHPYVRTDQRDDFIQIALLMMLEKVIPNYDFDMISEKTGRPIKFITFAQSCLFNNIKRLAISEWKNSKRLPTRTNMSDFAIESIADENVTDFAEVEQSLNAKSTVNYKLGLLNDRERIVIGMRFGLNGYSETTLEKVGEVLSVSKERARQIQNRALKLMQV
jgi:RNA polymerase primary sigma factor